MLDGYTDSPHLQRKSGRAAEYPRLALQGEPPTLHIVGYVVRPSRPQMPSATTPRWTLPSARARVAACRPVDPKR